MMFNMDYKGKELVVTAVVTFDGEGFLETCDVEELTDVYGNNVPVSRELQSAIEDHVVSDDNVYVEALSEQKRSRI